MKCSSWSLTQCNMKFVMHFSYRETIQSLTVIIAIIFCTPPEKYCNLLCNPPKIYVHVVSSRVFKNKQLQCFKHFNSKTNTFISLFWDQNMNFVGGWTLKARSYYTKKIKPIKFKQWNIRSNKYWALHNIIDNRNGRGMGNTQCMYTNTCTYEIPGFPSTF